MVLATFFIYLAQTLSLRRQRYAYAGLLLKLGFPKD